MVGLSSLTYRVLPLLLVLWLVGADLQLLVVA
jgi:hypothetical protein